jgi:uncharacterized repeat protein (TIGR01451 family)
VHPLCLSRRARGLFGAVAALLILSVAVPQSSSAVTQPCAAPGADGPGETLAGVINTYYPGSLTAPAGATSISVGSPSGASTAIHAGDLLLVIEMQDEAINSSNTLAYGAGNGSGAGFLSGSAGDYEYVVASGPVAGGAVPIVGAGAGGGLLNSYVTGAASTTHGQSDFQVVRVPQYSSATLGSSLTAQPWNGVTGGILAFDVTGALSLGGATVDLDGTGFRGGGARRASGGPGGSKEDVRNLSSEPFDGSKGEGAAGTPEWVYNQQAGTLVDTGQPHDGYPNGSIAMGAPGNAGGGATDAHPSANDQNSGGGGGANGGEGGMGGNSWNTNLPVGGRGGAAFPAQPSQLVLGGGGGAGSRNNSVAGGAESSGGAGGGIVLIRAGSVTGTGTITANGMSGPAPENDGGGGGGAGGSVEILAGGGELTGLTVTAHGGIGADAWPTGGGSEANRHGPGGGGGGGVVITSSPTHATNVAGGLHGTTTLAKYQYNAQNGGEGAVSSAALTAATGAAPGALCLPLVDTTKAAITPTVITSGDGSSAIYKITVTNSATLGAAQNVSVTDALPSGFTYASTGSFVTTGGATRDTVVSPVFGDSDPTWGSVTMPGGSSFTLEFTALIAATVAPGTYTDSAGTNYLDPQRSEASVEVNGPGTGPAAPVAVIAGPAPPGDAAANTRVTLRKLVRPSLVDPGGRLFYRLIVHDAGARVAKRVQVCDVLPQQTTIKRLGVGQLLEGRVCFTLAQLEPGQSHLFTLVLRADSNATATITNRATAAGANFPTVSAHATARVRSGAPPRADTRGVTG